MKSLCDFFANNPWNALFSIGGFIVGILGIIFSIIQMTINQKLQKKIRSITWQDMEHASRNIAQQLIKNYHPDIIYIPNVKSGIMLQFVKNYFSEYIPVIAGQTIPIEPFLNQRGKIKDIHNYWLVDTNKWLAYVPKSLYEYKDKNILILDNLSLTGNFLQTITKELIKNGIPKEHLASACIATTGAAIRDHTAPEFYYRVLDDSQDVYMPWGK